MAKVAPDLQAQIVAMRAAGWTVASIAGHTGVSETTIKRICSRNSVTPGEDHDALVTAARKELTYLLADDQRIRTILGSLILDTLSHIGLAREKALDALDKLTPTDTKSASMTLRGIAAHAVATKTHADTLRALLGRPEADPDELPILRIETLTQEEIEAMRAEQRRECDLLEEDTGIGGDEEVIE